MSKLYTVVYNDKYYCGGKNIIKESRILKENRITIFSPLHKLCKKYKNNIVEIRLIDNDFCKIKFGLFKIDLQRSLLIIYELKIKGDYKESKKIVHIDHNMNIDCAIDYYGVVDILNFLKSINVKSEKIIFSDNKKSVVIIIKYDNKYQTNLYQFGKCEAYNKPLEAIENDRPNWFESPLYWWNEANTIEEIVELAKELIKKINDDDRL